MLIFESLSNQSKHLGNGSPRRGGNDERTALRGEIHIEFDAGSDGDVELLINNFEFENEFHIVNVSTVALTYIVDIDRVVPDFQTEFVVIHSFREQNLFVVNNVHEIQLVVGILVHQNADINEVVQIQFFNFQTLRQHSFKFHEFIWNCQKFRRSLNRFLLIVNHQREPVSMVVYEGVWWENELQGIGWQNEQFLGILVDATRVGDIRQIVANPRRLENISLRVAGQNVETADRSFD